jgi:hypothetical protein
MQEGRAKITEHPFTDGWSFVGSWPGIEEGYYCLEHGEAIEMTHEESLARRRRTKALARRKIAGRRAQ